MASDRQSQADVNEMKVKKQVVQEKEYEDSVSTRDPDRLCRLVRGYQVGR